MDSVGLVMQLILFPRGGMDCVQALVVESLTGRMDSAQRPHLPRAVLNRFLGLGFPLVLSLRNDLRRNGKNIPHARQGRRTLDKKWHLALLGFIS